MRTDTEPGSKVRKKSRGLVLHLLLTLDCFTARVKMWRRQRPNDRKDAWVPSDLHFLPGLAFGFCLWHIFTQLGNRLSYEASEKQFLVSKLYVLSDAGR